VNCPDTVTIVGHLPASGGFLAGAGTPGKQWFFRGRCMNFKHLPPPYPHLCPVPGPGQIRGGRETASNLLFRVIKVLPSLLGITQPLVLGLQFLPAGTCPCLSPFPSVVSPQKKVQSSCNGLPSPLRADPPPFDSLFSCHISHPSRLSPCWPPLPEYSPLFLRLNWHNQLSYST
jgi:hypothetical protein